MKRGTAWDDVIVSRNRNRPRELEEVGRLGHHRARALTLNTTSSPDGQPEVAQEVYGALRGATELLPMYRAPAAGGGPFANAR